MTHLLRDIRAMHLTLDSRPDDWGTRLILADALSEAGLGREEACQRWMAANEKCVWAAFYGMLVFRWWSDAFCVDRANWCEILPERIHFFLPGRFVKEGGWWARVCDRATRLAAEEALAEALVLAKEIML
jgi:hypothetical protein